jgi:hypothetical protein
MIVPPAAAVQWAGMKRLFCWLFNIFAAMSLLLCLATAAMWVRSWVVADEWVFYDAHGDVSLAVEFRSELPHEWYLTSECGHVTCIALFPLHASNNRIFRVGVHHVRPPADERADFSGYSQPFPGLRIHDYGPIAYWCIVLSYWLPFLITAILPAAWLITRVGRTKRRWKKLGLCLHCGYDLRAHQPGDKCPECGTLIVTQPGSGVLLCFPQKINREGAKRAKNT